MTESAVTQKQTIDTFINRPHTLATIDTPDGTCAVFNVDIVHPKIVAILGHALNSEKFAGGVMNIVFRADGWPKKSTDNNELKDLFGAANVDMAGFAVNLPTHFNEAFKTVMEKDQSLSLMASFWTELLITMFHEIYHLGMWRRGMQINSEADVKNEDTMANEWAKTMMLEIVVDENIDTTPPTIQECPLFLHLFSEKNDEANEWTDDNAVSQWLHQLDMVDSGWVWKDEELDQGLRNYDEYIVTEFGVADVPVKFENGDGEKVVITNKDTGSTEGMEVSSMNDLIPKTPAVVKTEAVEVATPSLDAAKAAKDERVLGTPEVPTQLQENIAAVKAAFGTPVEPVVPVVPVPVAETTTPITDPGNPLADVDPEMLELLGYEESGEIDNSIGLAAAAPVTPVTPVTPVVPEAHEAPTYTAPAATTAPNETQDFDPAQVGVALHAVYKRLFDHIFNKCGWTGQGFSNVGAVLEPIAITDIPGAAQLVVAMDTVDQYGKSLADAPAQGSVKGLVFTKTGLPAYHLTIKTGSVTIIRRLVPQNPHKTNGSGQLTKPAIEASNGNCIGWVIDGTDKRQVNAIGQPVNNGDQFKMKYLNGVLINL